MKEKVKELTPLLEWFKQNIAMAKVDGDQAENQRRSEFSRYAHRLPTTHTLVHGLLSALEEIEKRSRTLLEKGAAARLVDKDVDSAEVAALVERLRGAITHYQVSGNYFFGLSVPHTKGQISQQQAIYDGIANLTVSTFLLVCLLCS